MKLEKEDDLHVRTREGQYGIKRWEHRVEGERGELKLDVPFNWGPSEFTECVDFCVGLGIYNRYKYRIRTAEVEGATPTLVQL